MTDALPELADALPAAERMCARAVAGLDAIDQGPERVSAVVAGVVGVLEAAGGPDVGNAVRAHLERTGAEPTTPLPADRGRERVLTAALRLFLAAEDDLSVALARAGLSAAGAADEQGDAGARRRERAEFADRVLVARREAVQAVLRSLAAGDLLPGRGSWSEALTEPTGSGFSG